MSSVITKQRGKQKINSIAFVILILVRFIMVDLIAVRIRITNALELTFTYPFVL